jgi:hypothetical protein
MPFLHTGVKIDEMLLSLYCTHTNTHRVIPQYPGGICSRSQKERERETEREREREKGREGNKERRREEGRKEREREKERRRKEGRTGKQQFLLWG